MKKGFYVLLLIPFFAKCTSDVHSVTIGNQSWSNTNLDVATFRNGDTIKEAKTNEEWMLAELNGEPAWCYYDNDVKNGVENGKLYNWYAVNDKRGLAPEGWRIPSDADWNALSDFLGGSLVAAKKMKHTLGWDNKGDGTNEYGFAALPAGFRKSTGEFSSKGCFALFWSSSEFDAKIATYRYLDCTTDELSSFNYLKGDGLSVRLIKE
jgi:uncharacterized protein (TIGR02145 family)